MTHTSPTLPPAPQDMDVLPTPQADQAFLNRLALRRSTKVAHLTAPGPTDPVLQDILALGARVPDHGKLGPWRFIILTGDARSAYGQKLAALLQSRQAKTPEDQLQAERARFERAPVVVAVVSAPVPSLKVPEWEQVLSSAAVCYNLMLAANGFGFAGCWLTEWMAFDPEALAIIGVLPSEKLAGFIYLGTPSEAPIERGRPDVSARTTYWRG